MGIGKIKENLENGKYKVEIFRDLTQLEELKALYNIQILKIKDSIKKELEEIEILNQELNNLLLIFNSDFEDSSFEETLKKAQEIGNIRETLKGKNKKVELFNAQKTGKELQIKKFNTELKPLILDCWCADFTDNLPPNIEVATIEIDDEYNNSNKNIIISPQSLIADNNDVLFWDSKINGFVSNLSIINTDINNYNFDLKNIEQEAKRLLSNILTNSEIVLISVDENVIVTAQNNIIKDRERLVFLDREKLRILALIARKIEDKKQLTFTIEVLKSELEDLQNSINTSSFVPKKITKRTGVLQPVLASETLTIMYNFVLFLTSQKFSPNYKIGTISAINEDSVNLTLDNKISSLKELIILPDSNDIDYSITQLLELENVPIQYMSCGSEVFEIGDRVIIYFDRNFKTPLCVGFESNPRDCVKFYMSINVSQTNFLQEKKLSVGVIKDGVNFLEKEFLAGNIDWRSGNKLLSWNGSVSRIMGYGTMLYDFSTDLQTLDQAYNIRTLQIPDLLNNNNDFIEIHLAYFNRWGNQIYKDGEVLSTTPNKVLGACIDDDNILKCITYDDSNFEEDKLFYSIDGNWQLIETLSYNDSNYIILDRETPCFFSKNGDKVIIVIDRILKDDLYKFQQGVIRNFNNGQRNLQLIERVYTVYNVTESGLELITTFNSSFGVEHNILEVYNNQPAVGGIDAANGTITLSQPSNRVVLALDWYIDNEGLESLNYLYSDVDDSSYNYSRSASLNSLNNYTESSTQYSIFYSNALISSQKIDITFNNSFSNNGLNINQNGDGSGGNISGGLSSSSSSIDNNAFIYYCDLRKDVLIFKNFESDTTTSQTQTINNANPLESQQTNNINVSEDTIYRFLSKENISGVELKQLNYNDTSQSNNTISTDLKILDTSIHFDNVDITFLKANPVNFVDGTYINGQVFYARDKRNNELFQLYSKDFDNNLQDNVQSFEGFSLIKGVLNEGDFFNDLYVDEPNSTQQNIYGYYERFDISTSKQLINEGITGLVVGICAI